MLAVDNKNLNVNSVLPSQAAKPYWTKSYTLNGLFDKILSDTS